MRKIIIIAVLCLILLLFLIAFAGEEKPQKKVYAQEEKDIPAYMAEESEAGPLSEEDPVFKQNTNVPSWIIAEAGSDPRVSEQIDIATALAEAGYTGSWEHGIPEYQRNIETEPFWHFMPDIPSE